MCVPVNVPLDVRGGVFAQTSLFSNGMVALKLIPHQYQRCYWYYQYLDWSAHLYSTRSSTKVKDRFFSSQSLFLWLPTFCANYTYKSLVSSSISLLFPSLPTVLILILSLFPAFLPVVHFTENVPHFHPSTILYSTSLPHSTSILLW